MSSSLNSSNNQRRDAHKNIIKYNILLLGADNLGKATFANNLLNKKIFTNDSSQQYSNIIPEVVDNHSYATNDKDEAVKITKPVKVALYTDGYNLLEATNSSLSPKKQSNLNHNENESLFHLKSVDVSISSADEELNLTLLKSVAFGTSIDNEQNVTELQTFMEDLFDQVLAEETRIKRNPRFEDGRIHVTLYFLEPNGHGLRELDLKAMKDVSKYTNVLPVIARSDSFEASELKKFKQLVIDDLNYHHIPVFNFSVTNDVLDKDYEDDFETIKDNEYLNSIQPFSIVTSDEVNSEGAYCRHYNWLNDDVSVPIDTMEFNELSVLKRVLFGSHLQDFKDTMTNFLYESYRSNKLQSSFAQPKNNGGISQSPSFVDLKKNNIQNINSSSSTPSLSNFQQLVINGQPSTYSLSRLAQQNPEQTKENSNNEEFDVSHRDFHSSNETNSSLMRDKQNLRNISQTVPYQLTRDRLLHQKHKLEKIETDSAKELQQKIEDLEKKAMELKRKEKMLKLQRLKQQQEAEDLRSVASQNTDIDLVKEIGPTGTDAFGSEEVSNSNFDDSFNNSVIKTAL